MTHPLVTQLRFTRSEFVRGLEGVSDAEARRRFEPMNCIGWIVGHLANQENRYWVMYAQGERSLSVMVWAITSRGYMGHAGERHIFLDRDCCFQIVHAVEQGEVSPDNRYHGKIWGIDEFHIASPRHPEHSGQVFGTRITAYVGHPPPL